MQKAGLKRAVMIVENPQTGEILAMVSLPTYNNNTFATGISSKAFKALLNNPNQPLLNHAINEQYPPGLDLQARDRPRGARRQQARAHRARPDQALRARRHDEVLGLEPVGLRAPLDQGGASPTRATRSSTRSPSAWGSTAWRTGRASSASARRPRSTSGRSARHRPDRPVEDQPLRPGDPGGRSAPGRDRPGLRHGHAAPAAQRLRGAGERRHPLPAPGRPRGPRPGRIRRATVQAEDPAQDQGARRRLHAHAHRRAGGGHEPPHVQPRRAAARGRRQDRHRRVRDEGQQGSPAVPQLVRRVRAGPTATSPKHDSKLAVLAFAYDSNTVGNVATEMVKYYLQLHYHLNVDKRRPDLLRKGNFYGGN